MPNSTHKVFLTAGEKAWWLHTPAALAEDLDFVPSVHMADDNHLWLKYQGSNALFRILKLQVYT